MVRPKTAQAGMPYARKIAGHHEHYGQSVPETSSASRTGLRGKTTHLAAAWTLTSGDREHSPPAARSLSVSQTPNRTVESHHSAYCSTGSFLRPTCWSMGRARVGLGGWAAVTVPGVVPDEPMRWQGVTLAFFEQGAAPTGGVSRVRVLRSLPPRAWACCRW